MSKFLICVNLLKPLVLEGITTEQCVYLFRAQLAHRCKGSHVPSQFFLTPPSCMSFKYQKSIIRLMPTRTEHFKTLLQSSSSFLNQGICLWSVSAVINTLVTIPPFIFRHVTSTRHKWQRPEGFFMLLTGMTRWLGIRKHNTDLHVLQH